MPTTRKTLLHRVRDPGDREAWEQFFALYAPLLERYARARGLPPAEAEEVRDACLAALAERMPSFEYERGRGSFQGWLHTLASGKVLDLLRRSRARQAETGALLAIPSDAGAPDELWEERWRLEHLRHALEAAQRAETPAGRAALALLLDELPVPEICARTGLNRNQVYKAKARMLARVRTTLRGLGEPG